MPVSTPKIISVLAAFTILSTSCNFIAPTTEPEVAPTIVSQNGLPATEADVPRVTLEETLAAIQSGEAIVVDVRPPEDYQANHIVGAISIPLPEIETSPNSLDLDKDQWIITYCT